MATLFVVATPIGNLHDISQRALDTLAAVSLIACEDTRISKRLLDYHQIKTRMTSYHQHSGVVVTDKIIEVLKQGNDVALITDAGTPGISDPGGKLVAAAVEAGITVSPIPGASGITVLLSASGLPTDSFVFYGFIPHKKRRQTTFQEIAAENKTVVFYESPHRIGKTLSSLKEVLADDRIVVIGRELTKIHEEIVRGPISAVYQQLVDRQPRGEYVIAVGPKK